MVAESAAALIVVDIQNDFCDPNGATARSGKSVQAMMEIVPRLGTLVDAARAGATPVIFIQMLQTPWTQSKTYTFKGGDEPRVAKCVAGTWGAGFYGIAPLESEPVVVKHRYSAFMNTSLETILHGFRTTTVIMTGVATNVCVESTARDAFMRDYDVVVVSDCTATTSQTEHDASLYTIEKYFGRVATANDIISAWSSRKTGV